MIPIIIVTHHLQCPNCTLTIKRGLPRFGPARVRCGLCGHEIQTNLTPWQHLPESEKVLYALSEIIFPSRLGIGICVLLYPILVLPYTLFLLLVALALPIEGLLSVIVFIYALFAPTLFVFLLTTIRLFLLIKESDDFSKRRILPYWKARAIW
jgi:hypothetical protein